MSTKSTVTEKPGRTRGAVAATFVLALALLFLLGGIGRIMWGVQLEDSPRVTRGIIGLVIAAALGSTIRFIPPGHARVMRFFGRYMGTNRRTGLSLVPPLTYCTGVDLRERSSETAEVKVDDPEGRPVTVRASVTWRIADTAQATFGVDDAEEFLRSRAEATLRDVARSHSPLGGSDAAARELAERLSTRVEPAGLEIVEACILTPAPAV